MQNWIYTWFKKKKKTVLKEVHPEWQLCFVLPIPLTSPFPLFWSPPYFEYIYPPVQYTHKEGNMEPERWLREGGRVIGSRKGTQKGAQQKQSTYGNTTVKAMTWHADF